LARTAILVAFDVKPDRMAEFVEILRDHAAGTLAEEPGCEAFEVMVPKDGSPAVHLHEVYRDDEAFALHRNSARLAAVRERYKDMIFGRTLTVCDL